MGRVERDQLIEVGKIYLPFFVILHTPCTMQVMGVTLKPDIEVINTCLKETNPNECPLSISNFLKVRLEEERQLRRVSDEKLK